MPFATGFTMACFESDKVKVGDCLYSEAQFLELCATASELMNQLTQSADMLEAIMKGEDWGAIEEQIQDNRDAIAKATGAKQ